MTWQFKMEAELKSDWQRAHLKTNLAEQLAAIRDYYIKYRAYLQQKAFEKLLQEIDIKAIHKVYPLIKNELKQ